MTVAKTKFDPSTAKKANIPFLFNGVMYGKGEPFDPVKAKATMRQVRGLYGVRKLINASDQTVPTKSPMMLMSDSERLAQARHEQEQETKAEGESWSPAEPAALQKPFNPFADA